MAGTVAPNFWARKRRLRSEKSGKKPPRIKIKHVASFPWRWLNSQDTGRKKFGDTIENTCRYSLWTSVKARVWEETTWTTSSSARDF